MTQNNSELNTELKVTWYPEDADKTIIKLSASLTFNAKYNTKPAAKQNENVTGNDNDTKQGKFPYKNPVPFPVSSVKVHFSTKPPAESNDDVDVDGINSNMCSEALHTQPSEEHDNKSESKVEEPTGLIKQPVKTGDDCFIKDNNEVDNMAKLITQPVGMGDDIFMKDNNTDNDGINTLLEEFEQIEDVDMHNIDNSSKNNKEGDLDKNHLDTEVDISTFNSKSEESDIILNLSIIQPKASIKPGNKVQTLFKKFKQNYEDSFLTKSFMLVQL